MTDTRFSSSLSTLSDGTLALREAAQALEKGLAGQSPDLVVMFVSPHHEGTFDQIASRLGSLTGARVLIGCCGESVIGGSREMERVPALALWAVACEDLELYPFHLNAHTSELAGAPPGSRRRISYTGHPNFFQLPNGAGDSLLLFGDPFSFPMSDYLGKLHREIPALAVTGAMTTGNRRKGKSTLFLGDERLDGGAVGVYLRGGIELTHVTSQGHRPVGAPWVITSCEGPLVKKLGGKLAFNVLNSTLEGLTEEEKNALRRAPMLGVAWDATRPRFEMSDFHPYPIRGLASQGRSIVLSNRVRSGQTVQFMVRDPKAAGEDLKNRLARYGGAPPDLANQAGALVFTSSSRGSRMFDEPDHDAKRVQDHLGLNVPVAGFFAHGEIGRLGNRSHLYGFTASTAVYRAR
jgi:small ligand-binding sensory domain FIST